MLHLLMSGLCLKYHQDMSKPSKACAAYPQTAVCLSASLENSLKSLLGSWLGRIQVNFPSSM
jgi:hypothetical protein